MRNIPGTMATQHPDNAGAPYWDEQNRPFIGVHQEIEEAVHCFQDLGVSEFMWDWEGKFADAAVIDRLLSDYHEYFIKNQLGRDKFLTFRIPNIWEEKGYNLLQAMTVILSAEDFARDLKLHGRPLFEIILPMTQSADQLMHMHKLFQKLARFKSKDFTAHTGDNTDHLELIPLVESIESQHAVGELLEKYVSLHDKSFGYKPAYIRAFLACSDPALTSGFLSTVLANKIGLSQMYAFTKKSGIPIYPIAGSGSLPFRGGLSPKSIERFMTEFPGVRTVTIQSAFRYDYKLTEVKSAIKKLETELPKRKPRIFTVDEESQLLNISKISSKFYKTTLDAVLPDMERIFKSTPRRRDRRQHIGLLAYARSSGKHALPRAITFSAGFYSMGVPPELIGMGRTLAKLNSEQLKLLQITYPNMKADIAAAGAYLNRANLDKLANTNTAWETVRSDVELCEKVLGITLKPQTIDQKTHQELSMLALQISDKTEVARLITRMATIRQSLG